VDYGEHYESLGVSVSNFESGFVEQSRSTKDYSGEFLLFAGYSMPWNSELMMQFLNEEPEGVRYRRTYPYSEDPHIGIIDPRTGTSFSVRC
jgi:hypothetical protein